MTISCYTNHNHLLNINCIFASFCNVMIMRHTNENSTKSKTESFNLFRISLAEQSGQKLQITKTVQR